MRSLRVVLLIPMRSTGLFHKEKSPPTLQVAHNVPHGSPGSTYSCPPMIPSDSLGTGGCGSSANAETTTIHIILDKGIILFIPR